MQAEQEALMASAWEQLGELEAINQRLRQAQLSRAVNERYHTKTFARFTPDAFMRVVAPAKSRFTIAGLRRPAKRAMLFAQQLARSFVPPTAVVAERAQALPSARRDQPPIRARRGRRARGSLFRLLQPARAL